MRRGGSGGGIGASVTDGDGWAAFAAAAAARRTGRDVGGGRGGGGWRPPASGGDVVAAAGAGLAFHDVAREVLAFAATHGGTPGVMPTPAELRRLGRGATAVAVGGWGWAATAARLGLMLPAGVLEAARTGDDEEVR